MGPRLTASLIAATALLSVALPASCAGCSEECRDTKQGSEGCPCSSDQDCTTRLGEVLLCSEEGACEPADPPDAPAESCDNDGDCGDGEACGLGLCSPAPSCQRIDVTTLRARERTGGVVNPTFDATVSRAGCDHEIASAAAELTLSDIAPKGGNAVVGGDCSGGAWFAAMQAGVFECGASTLIISADEPCFIGAAAACAEGTCTSIGSPLDEDAGVCR